jgi:hypothetical protein
MTLVHSISEASRRLGCVVRSMTLDVVLRWVVALVVLMAVASKCLSPGAITAVATYLLGREADHGLIAASLSALVMMESALALALVTGTYPRVTGIVAACFFGVLTLVLVRLSIDPTAPHCACMGAVHGGMLGESPGQSTIGGFVRNAGLIVASLMIARGARERARA